MEKISTTYGSNTGYIYQLQNLDGVILCQEGKI